MYQARRYQANADKVRIAELKADKLDLTLKVLSKTKRDMI